MIVIKKEDFTIFAIAYSKTFSDNTSYHVENNGDYYNITFTDAPDDSIFKLGMCFNELKPEGTKPLSQSDTKSNPFLKTPKLKTYYTIVVLAIFILFYFSVNSLTHIDNNMDYIKQAPLDSILIKQKTIVYDTNNKNYDDSLHPRR